MKRVISGLLATALLGFTPIALAGSASAETSVSGRNVAESGPQQEATRKVTLNGNRVGTSNRFIVKGSVTPNYRNSKVIIKKANCAECNNFKPFKTITTNGQGKYRTGVAVPRRVGSSVSYIAIVPKRGAYAAKRSNKRYTLTRTS